MPETKMKPAATPKQPEAPQPTAEELRKAETEREFQTLNHLAKTFWEEMSLHHFQALKTFKLILDRDAGSTTPVEDFLTSLIHLYQLRDDEGKGLTLKDIEWRMHQDLLDEDALPRAIREAHFVASRYPLPAPDVAQSE